VSTARLVVTRPEPSNDSDLGAWAIFDLELRRWSVVKHGPLRGLAWVRVPKDRLEIVRARAERDSVWRGPTRVMRLDCLACAACCVKNRVVLERADIERLGRGGRAEIARAPFARREDGRIVLVLTRSGRCKHLGANNACAIYGLRPRACAAFPAGSECCLSAREEELGVVDG
jgi:Fe-S-cluster containining protein